MRFAILGPLEVRRDDDTVVTLGGSKPRAVLAMLLLGANKPVSAERLARGLWGDDAPATAVRTVQVHVSRLRKALGEQLALSRNEAGYRLVIGPEDLDAARFERLLGESRTVEPARARKLLGVALGLWRGEPLSGPPPFPWSQVDVVVVAVCNRRLCTDFSRAPALVPVRARPSGSPAA